MSNFDKGLLFGAVGILAGWLIRGVVGFVLIRRARSKALAAANEPGPTIPRGTPVPNVLRTIPFRDAVVRSVQDGSLWRLKVDESTGIANLTPLSPPPTPPGPESGLFSSPGHTGTDLRGSLGAGLNMPDGTGGIIGSIAPKPPKEAP